MHQEVGGPLIRLMLACEVLRQRRNPRPASLVSLTGPIVCNNFRIFSRTHIRVALGLLFCPVDFSSIEDQELHAVEVKSPPDPVLTGVGRFVIIKNGALPKR